MERILQAYIYAIVPLDTPDKMLSALLPHLGISHDTLRQPCCWSKRSHFPHLAG